MATSKHPIRPECDGIDDDLQRTLDRHAEYADDNQARVSREQLLREGLAKLKTAEPR
ncbi:MAG: hypothetical protein ACRD4Q_12945 [Candidatus Acidiferrales bacterium]